MRKIITLAVPLLFAASVNANSDVSLPSEHQIQTYMNDSWAPAMLNTFMFELCGRPDEAQKTAKEMLFATPDEFLSSPITFGFAMGYSNHLSTLIRDKQNVERSCLKYNDHPPLLDQKSSDAALEALNQTIDLKSYMGENNTRSLTISLYNLDSKYSSQLSRKLLAEACEYNSADIRLPNLLEIVNSAQFSVKPTAQEIQMLTQAWRGYSQGMYWHAISLVSNLSETPTNGKDSEKKEFCMNVIKSEDK